tara:strand:- start:75 stop:254 length:180 start_codon:yes stop_codon:yes gene_type:complete
LNPSTSQNSDAVVRIKFVDGYLGEGNPNIVLRKKEEQKRDVVESEERQKEKLDEEKEAK